MKPAISAQPVTKCCVADGVTTQRDMLPFKRVYLCALHRSLWDAADARDREREARRARRGGAGDLEVEEIATGMVRP